MSFQFRTSTDGVRGQQQQQVSTGVAVMTLACLIKVKQPSVGGARNLATWPEDLDPPQSWILDPGPWSQWEGCQTLMSLSLLLTLVAMKLLFLFLPPGVTGCPLYHNGTQLQSSGSLPVTGPVDWSHVLH